MKRIIVVTLLSTAVFVASVAPSGAHTHSNATGEVTLTGSAFGDRHTVFDAHDDAPAAGSSVEDRGSVFFEITSGPNAGSEMTADLDCVEVDGEDAYFSGLLTSGTGFYASYYNTGRRVYGHVYDGGTPGRNGDTWMAGFNAESGPCSAPLGGHAVSDGNLTVR